MIHQAKSTGDKLVDAFFDGKILKQGTLLTKYLRIKMKRFKFLANIMDTSNEIYHNTRKDNWDFRFPLGLVIL